MVQIKNPQQYINAPGSLQEAGKYISELGKHNVLVIAGPQTREAIGSILHESLKKRQIAYQDIVFTGYPTNEQANNLAKIARAENIDLLIAAGGGRAMDVTKAAGDIARLPVLTIPTVLGTCAAWAACSVLYNDEGDYVQCRYNQQAPVIVLADTQLLARSPVRYLKAGIADTYAKWYELRPVINGLQARDASKEIAFYAAELALNTLAEKGHKAVLAQSEGRISKELYDVIDSIIYLAGFVGSISDGDTYIPFAHQFYNSVRGVPASKQRLHGEIVGYGLIVQSLLNEDMIYNVKRLVAQLKEIDNLFTLAELGLGKAADQAYVAERIVREYEASTILLDKHSPAAIIEAMQLAERYAKDDAFGA